MFLQRPSTATPIKQKAPHLKVRTSTEKVAHIIGTQSYIIRIGCEVLIPICIVFDARVHSGPTGSDGPNISAEATSPQSHWTVGVLYCLGNSHTIFTYYVSGFFFKFCLSNVCLECSVSTI